MKNRIFVTLICLLFATPCLATRAPTVVTTKAADDTETSSPMLGLTNDSSNTSSTEGQGLTSNPSSTSDTSLKVDTNLDSNSTPQVDCKEPNCKK